MSRPPRLRRALIVDDGPMNQRLLQGLLDQLGWAADTASSGDEGLAKCQLTTYDVIFVDLHMPGLGGTEMVEILRESERECHTPRTRVVVVTADDAPPPGDHGWFDVFLSKPITSALIRASLDVLAVDDGSPPSSVATERPLDLVDEFLAAMHDSLSRMKVALELGDFQSVSDEAHGLKGTGTSFGFQLVSVVGARLEQDAKAHSRAGVERGLLQLEQCLSCT